MHNTRGAKEQSAIILLNLIQVNQVKNRQDMVPQIILMRIAR